MMQGDEDYKAMVTKKNFGELYNQIEKQNKVTQYVSIINPFIAVRDLSMGICQTDYANQIVFEQQVETYRLYMMRYLNEYMSYHTKAGDYKTKATRDVFTGLKKFTYKPLTIYQSIVNYSLLVIALLLWLVLGYISIEWASKKLTII
jgi:ABC-2 type transport system permease protein